MLLNDVPVGNAEMTIQVIQNHIPGLLTNLTLYKCSPIIIEKEIDVFV